MAHFISNGRTDGATIAFEEEFRFTFSLGLKVDSNANTSVFGINNSSIEGLRDGYSIIRQRQTY